MSVREATLREMVPIALPTEGLVNALMCIMFVSFLHNATHLSDSIRSVALTSV